jgi:hypothetical protein
MKCTTISFKLIRKNLLIDVIERHEQEASEDFGRISPGSSKYDLEIHQGVSHTS